MFHTPYIYAESSVSFFLRTSFGLTADWLVTPGCRLKSSIQRGPHQNPSCDCVVREQIVGVAVVSTNSNQQQYVKTDFSSLPLQPTGFIKPNLYFQSEWFLFFSLCGTSHSFTAAPWVVGNFHANHGRPEQSNMDQRHRKEAFGAAPPLQLLVGEFNPIVTCGCSGVSGLWDCPVFVLSGVC